MANFTTADVAKAGRTTARGIHIWDRQGLLGFVERGRFHDRVFTQEHVQRAKLIAAAQMAGLSLAEIQLALIDQKAMTKLHLAVEEAMIFLKRARDSIFLDFDL